MANSILHLNLQEKIEKNYSNGHKYGSMLQADSNQSLPSNEVVQQEKKIPNTKIKAILDGLLLVFKNPHQNSRCTV